MMQGQVPVQSRHRPGAAAAALPGELFSQPGFAEPRASVLPTTPERHSDRLPWPMAAGVILASCATLWLGIAGLARLVLG